MCSAILEKPNWVFVRGGVGVKSAGRMICFIYRALMMADEAFSLSVMMAVIAFISTHNVFGSICIINKFARGQILVRLKSVVGNYSLCKTD